MAAPITRVMEAGAVHREGGSASAPRRWVLAAVTVALVAITLVGVLYSALSVGFACDGDGGIAHSAAASPRCEFIDSFWSNSFGDADHSKPAWIALLSSPLLPLLGGGWAVRARRWKPLLVAGAVGLALAVLPTATIAILPRTCHPDDPTRAACSHT